MAGGISKILSTYNHTPSRDVRIMKEEEWTLKLHTNGGVSKAILRKF